MGLYFGFLVSLAFIAFTANAFFDGYTESKNIPQWEKIIGKVIVGTILFGALMLSVKCGCSSEYEYTPSGETTLEHYEPR